MLPGLTEFYLMKVIYGGKKTQARLSRLSRILQMANLNIDGKL